jgi:dihydroxyacetone kinase-like predicted kinase
MGRSFESIRMGIKDVSARWLKASRALKKEDQIYGQMLAEMAKKHSSEAFYALDDPLEAAVFSVLLEVLKEMDKADCENESVELTISNVKVNS